MATTDANPTSNLGSGEIEHRYAIAERNAEIGAEDKIKIGDLPHYPSKRDTIIGI